MRLAKQVIGACAAVALVAVALDAHARGGKGGGGRSGGHHAHSGSHHRTHANHGYSTFFVASTFVAWPTPYYWPDYNPAAVAVVEHWYYCQPYAAYYPYVQECPVEWQPVLPTAPSPEYIER
jgi:hypothetical protein